MRINYKKLFNLRKLLSDPKKLFSVLIFTLVVVFIQNYIAQNSSFEGKVV
ncbi:TPA: nuclease, partial [Campylobacter jejuni]|nr:nuclease [Campylobacter jejuni]